MTVAVQQLPHRGSDAHSSDNGPEEKMGDLESRGYVDIDDGYEPEFIKKTMRQIDWRLIPMLSACYCISIMDRANLATARAANERLMDKQLKTNQGNHYSIVTIVFFIPYIIFELPSQIGLNKFGAAKWLGSAVFLWGVATIASGFVKTWQALAGMRALLGFFEAALFPGANLLISCWYPRRMMASRNTIFYLCSSVIGSFSGPIGYAFTLAHGRSGLAGWQWMYLIYGLITVAIGITCWFVLVDVPEKAKFLTAEQREFIITRIERDRRDSEYDPLTFANMREYCCDFKVWLFCFFFTSTTTTTYALAYFLPPLLTSMGFNNVESMCLGTPGHIWGIIPGLITGYVSDRKKNARAWCLFYNSCNLLVGMCMLSQLPTNQKHARYAGVFLAFGGACSNVPLVLSWAQVSIRRRSKRAFTAAIVVAGGGIGGIFAGSLFMQKEAPHYKTGIFFTLGVNGFSTLAYIGLHIWMRAQNRKADKGLVVLEGDGAFRYQP